MIAFAKNSDIQKWFEAKNMSRSNSTQNDWEKRMYSLFEKFDMTTLAEISEILYEHASPYGEINTPVGKWVFINPINKQWFSKQELADARREKWIDSDCEHLWSSTTEGQRVRICLLCNREQVLATLREEEGAVK